MITSATLTRGLRNGLKMTWELAKIVIPVYFVITFLKYTPVLTWVSDFMSPVMHLAGLPGEASVPLVLGYFLNIYAAIGSILPLEMDVKEITIISAMLLLAHSLPMETAIAKKTGANTFSLVMVRIILSFIMGMFFNFVL